MNTKTAIIVEDEYPARYRMQQLLLEHTNEINLIGDANTGKKAIVLIESKKPDVIFLDIQLPDMTGFEVLQKLSYSPWIIFTTAYSEYALKAFENHSIDYLIKPIENDRFALAMDKLMHWKNKQNIDISVVQQMIQSIQKPAPSLSLSIKKKDKIILVDYDKIAFFQADDKYVNVHLKNGDQHLLSKSLSQLTDDLPQEFIRIHRSYIVNRNYVTEIHRHFKGKFVLQLSDVHQNKITSGETYTAVVKSAFDF